MKCDVSIEAEHLDNDFNIIINNEQNKIFNNND
jgi:hypothetical protein